MFKKEFRKKLLVIVGAVLMSCSLLGCGDKKSSDTTTATAKEESKDKTTEEKKEEKKEETTEKKEDKTTEKKEETTEAKKEETTEAKKEETTEKKEETTAFDTEEGPTTAEDADTDISEESSSNAAMNFIGSYVCGRATAGVSVSQGLVTIEISNPYDAGTIYHWSMSGKMNPDTLNVEFENCIKIIEHLDPEEGQPERESAYKYGAGMISFANDENNTPVFVWYDETENAGSGMDFVYQR